MQVGDKEIPSFSGLLEQFSPLLFAFVVSHVKNMQIVDFDSVQIILRLHCILQLFVADESLGLLCALVVFDR